MLTLMTLFLILLPQLWAARRGKGAAQRIALLLPAPMLATGLTYAMLTRRVLLARTDGNAYHDTYYVVAHFHYAAFFVIALGLLSVLLYFADPAAHPLPKVTRWLASLLALSTAEMLMRPLVYTQLLSPPARYSEYAEWAAIMGRIQFFTNMLFVGTWLALFLFGLFALLRRLNEWSKTP